MDYVDVLPVLTPVVIGGDVRAVIIGVTIRPAHRGAVTIHYECEWWVGREIHTHVFDSDLVKPADTTIPLRVGFSKEKA